MPKIVKSESAPDGLNEVILGQSVIEFGSNSSFDTDDPALVEQARRHAYLDVDDSAETKEQQAQVDEQARISDKLSQARDDAKRHNAEKDAREPGVVPATTPEELKAQEKSTTTSAKKDTVKSTPNEGTNPTSGGTL